MNETVCTQEVSEYRSRLIDEMDDKGATPNEIDLISDRLIINSIINRRNVKDVTWAILQ